MLKKIEDLNDEEIIFYLKGRMCDYCKFKKMCPRFLPGSSLFPPCQIYEVESDICKAWKRSIINDPNDIDYQKKEIEIKK